jgi:Ca2+-binding EF-hand superfamily protein
MRKLLLAAALAGTMIGGAAVAAQSDGQDTGQNGGRGGMMMRADTNGDGMISRAEYMAQADARFARMDKNGDGQLSGDELGGPGRHGGGMMMAADTNHDGVITRAEYDAQAADRFAKLDANGDGQVSPDEMKAAMGRMRGGQDGAAPHPAAQGPMGHHRHGDLMTRLDTNHDGRISRDEMRAQADARFDKLDTNHDGFIDKAELDAAHAKMKERFSKMREHRHAGAPGAAPAPGSETPAPDASQ